MSRHGSCDENKIVTANVMFMLMIVPVTLIFGISEVHAVMQICSALTEKIVSALNRMKCPHRLEPHQIQGQDYIHIYPVVQVCI